MYVLPINKEEFELKLFSCGQEGINYFLKNKALIDHNNRVSSTYILKNESRIVVFYTLGVSTFDFSDQDRSI